jgi:hypothetical protein
LMFGVLRQQGGEPPAVIERLLAATKLAARHLAREHQSCPTR